MATARCSARNAFSSSARRAAFAASRSDAAMLQKCVLDGSRDEDWLFRQSRRIADALNMGGIALAQIYGLYIPIGELDDGRLRRLATAGFAKADFNPDEPRVPKGDPHGGEWTSGGGGTGTVPASAASTAAGGGPATVAELDASPRDAGRGAPSRGDGDEPAAPASTPPLKWEYGPVEAAAAGPADTSGDSALAPGGASSIPTVFGFAGNETTWLAGDLSATTLAALRSMLVGAAGASTVFGILFIPTNRALVVEGPIAGSDGLAYRYDRDTGVLQIRQNVRSLGSAVLTEAHLGTDGLFRDAEGHIIGRYLSGDGVIVDMAAQPGFRMLPGTAAAPDAATRNDNQPKLCPDPTPDRPGAPKDNRYQRYVSMLVNGRALPPGIAVSLFNPLSGKDVVFDDCRLSDGTMIEAKGDGYLEMLLNGSDRMPWLGIEAKLVKQANSQLEAAQGRPIEWYFKDRPVADFVRKLFSDGGLRITVIYAPQAE